MKTKDLLKTKLSSLAGPPLRQPRPLDERLRPARRQPDDHDDRDGRQSGIRLRRPQATVETFTQVPDYTVTFQADGATVKTMTVEDGYVLKDSDYPAVPTKTGYTGEWVKYTSAVHSNVTVQAKYTAVVTKYTVTFKADNTVVKTMTVKDGYTLKASDYPTVPAKSGYKGSWKRYTAAIHSDITIDAVYEPVIVTKQYTVVFRADAKVLKTMKVEVGYTLQDSDYPEIPAKEGYTGHWDKSTTRIIKNTIINVIYSDNSSHVVTFIFDGVQIGTLTVTDGYVLKNSDYPSPFAPVGYIVTWEKYTLPIHSDITVTGKLQSDVTIPPQPTGPGEIMSGGEGEPVEADVPAEDETVAPQGMHVTGTQTVTHEYLTLNGKVARETIRTNNTLTGVLDFIYDESGKPFALKYSTNGTSFQTYYYVLNLQGDVVKLIHYIPGFEYESVATYEYDAWGNILSSSGKLAEINPLRYRGYYYDNETGFYYLQSRYYDPANRRFINADSYQSTGQGFVGTNMFAYCNNNTPIYSDPTGHALKPLTTAICDGGSGLSSSELKIVNELIGRCKTAYQEATGGAEYYRIAKAGCTIDAGGFASFVANTNGNYLYAPASSAIVALANLAGKIPGCIASIIQVALPLIVSNTTYGGIPIIDNGSYDVYRIDAVTSITYSINRANGQLERVESHWASAIYFPEGSDLPMAIESFGYTIIGG